VWDTLHEEKAGVLAGTFLTDEVKSIDLSYNGTTLVAGGKGGTVSLWDLA